MATTVVLMSAPTFADGLGLGLRAGLIGVGIDLTTRLTDKLNARIGFNYAPFDQEQTEDGINYNVDLNIRQLTAVLDYHPFAGNFRLTGGMVRNNTKFLFGATGQETYDIGNVTYQGDLTLDGSLSFQPVVPYLSIGFGNAVRPNKGLGFTAELGVMVSGKPNFELVASGTASASNINNGNPFDVTSSAAFTEDLRREEQQVQEDLEELEILPVLMLGLSYQF